MQDGTGYGFGVLNADDPVDPDGGGDGDGGGGSMWDKLGGGGSLLGAILGWQGQNQANKTNIELGREVMKFQERMSNTAYQRAMDDMRKAGLNPMLSAKLGGASSPSGSLTQVQNELGAGVTGAQQAMQMYQAYQQTQQSEAQTKLLAAETAKVRSETLTNDLNTAWKVSDKDLKDAQKALQRAQEMGRHIENQRSEGLFNEETEGGPGKNAWAADVAKRKAEAQLKQFGLSEARESSRFYDDAGQLPYALRILLQVLEGASTASRMR